MRNHQFKESFIYPGYNNESKASMGGRGLYLPFDSLLYSADENRTHTPILLAQDFKSWVSTNSTTTPFKNVSTYTENSNKIKI